MDSAWMGGAMALGIAGLGLAVVGIAGAPAARAQTALPPPDDGSIYTIRIENDVNTIRRASNSAGPAPPEKFPASSPMPVMPCSARATSA